jgi:hypothetical protein
LAGCEAASDRLAVFWSLDVEWARLCIYTKLCPDIPRLRRQCNTRLQINVCENFPRPPSFVQLGTLSMVALPSTGASRYQNCCIDGGTSSEYFGYTLVHTFDHMDTQIRLRLNSPCAKIS